MDIYQYILIKKCPSSFAGSQGLWTGIHLVTAQGQRLPSAGQWPHGGEPGLLRGPTPEALAQLGHPAGALLHRLGRRILIAILTKYGTRSLAGTRGTDPGIEGGL